MGPPKCFFCVHSMVPSVDKGKHGFDGQKCAHTASSPLAIRQVFPAGLFLSGHISAPAKLLRTCQRWIFQGFLVFEPQAGRRPPRRKGQKAPKRRGDRRVCPCQLMVLYTKASQKKSGKTERPPVEEKRNSRLRRELLFVNQRYPPKPWRRCAGHRNAPQCGSPWRCGPDGR